MCFVNELVPEEDLKKFGIRELRKRFLGGTVQPSWTVNREQGSFLLFLDKSIEEEPPKYEFYFHWKGIGLYMRLHRLSEKNNNNGWMIRYKLIGITDNLESPFGINSIRLSEVIENNKEVVFEEIRKSLREFGTIGTSFDDTKDHSVYDFDF